MIRIEKFSQIGGARLDIFNATWPFAKITATPELIELKCFSKKYQFIKDQIVDLREYTGIISNGLLIEHKVKKYPHHIVFWTFAFGKLKSNYSAKKCKRSKKRLDMVFG
jgi:hypothetical protein